MSVNLVNEMRCVCGQETDDNDPVLREEYNGLCVDCYEIAMGAAYDDDFLKVLDDFEDN